MIYLDNNATTRPLPDVLELFVRHSCDSFANPGSRHAHGRRARKVLEDAREKIAELLGAWPDEVVFTGGGTEANNLAVLGLAAGAQGAIALTAGEHPSVMQAARHRAQQGWRLEILPVDGSGRLHPMPALAERLPHDVKLVTVILANGETGVLQDLSPLAEVCHARGIPLHIDAVQAVGKIPVDFHSLKATSLSLGAHKFYGPRGVGALLLKRGARLAPLGFGGHQEAERRPGTEPVALIAGMARALEMFQADEARRTSRLSALCDQLERGLDKACAPVVVNGSQRHRLPNTLNIAFPGVDGEALLVALDLAGVACSLGSTCASGSMEPSPVLVAMNLPSEVLRSSVRFSVGIDNTEDEIARAVELVAACVTRLRAAAASTLALSS